MTLTLIKFELLKIFRKWRTYIGFLALTVLVPIIHIGMYSEGESYLQFLTQNIRQMFYFTGNFLNGYLIAQIVLGSLLVHIPFLITLVTGDLLAGEATAGTYRMLLTRPLSRYQVVIAKYCAGLIYTVMLVIWLAVMSLGLGIIIFGTGELISIKSEVITILGRNDILWRFAYVYAFSSLSMATVASLSFFFSSLVENSIGPIISTMTVIIVFLIISNLDVDLFKTVKPYLFTNYLADWRLFFDEQVDFRQILKSATILGSHCAGFLIATLFLFNRKDILS
jgi:ABC-2 type transport system permease protein